MDINYLRKVLSNIKGININDIYQDNNKVIIPIISDVNTDRTYVVDAIKKRLKNTWLSRYIEDIKVTQYAVEIIFTINENLNLKTLNKKLEEALKPLYKQ